MDNPKGVKSFHIQVDLQNGRYVGAVDDKETPPELSKIINEKAFASIKKAIANMTAWVKEYVTLIHQGHSVKAFELLQKKQGSIRFFQECILDEILPLDTEQLRPEQQMSFFIICVAIADKERAYAKVEKQIDVLLNKFLSYLPPGLSTALVLAKANAAATSERLNTANILYKQVIESADATATNRAFAHRGIALITPVPEDANEQELLAVDRFLEAGEVKEAVVDLVAVSKRYQSTDAVKSITFIDKAISLYTGSGQLLDKEYLASLHHTKGSYLYSINKLKEAFKSFKAACDLRDGLTGNEHETYSCLSAALKLSRNLKNGKVSYYKKKIEAIKPLLQTEEFLLQECLVEHINTGISITDDIIERIKRFPNQILRFSLYLLLSNSSQYSFLEKLEWLDKAKMELNEHESAAFHYSTYYFSVGELYRLNGKNAEAITAFQEGIRFNHFDYRLVQNCGALLWGAGNWQGSLKLFQDLISYVGESPTLLYCLGRSFFELGQFQDAFDTFKKIKTEIEGVDIKKYLLDCMEKTEGLRLTSADQSTNAPISLDAFYECLQAFSNTISNNSRMDFWKNNNGDYSWAASPEEKAKHYLITGLEMRFGKDCIDICQERRAGAGIIDLYITLRGGLKIVIELKICGSPGYSSTYALNGEDQLIHYLKNTETHFGFLLVFDARKRDFGKGFNPIQTFGKYTIQTLSIDLRPYV